MRAMWKAFDGRLRQLWSTGCQLEKDVGGWYNIFVQITKSPKTKRLSYIREPKAQAFDKPATFDPTSEKNGGRHGNHGNQDHSHYPIRSRPTHPTSLSLSAVAEHVTMTARIRTWRVALHYHGKFCTPARPDNQNASGMPSSIHFWKNSIPEQVGFLHHRSP